MSAPDVTSLRRDLISAADAKIARVVAMVDALPRRGVADGLIAPLRPRLAELGLPRRMNAGRLLFTPFDPLIVAPKAWKRGGPGIPRGALTPLADALRPALSPATAEAERLLAEADAGSIAVVPRAGEALWAEAGRALATLPMPAAWIDEAGLTEADFAALAPAMAVVLGVAPALAQLEQRAAKGGEPENAALEALLAPALAQGGLALAMILALLLARLPQSPTVNRLASRFATSASPAPLREAAEQATEFMLDSIEQAGPGSADPRQAATELRRLAAVLGELEARSSSSPARMQRVAAARRNLDTACRARFEGMLSVRVLEPLALLGDASGVDVAALERAARDLRRFETAARAIGGREHYERALRETARALEPAPDCGQVQVMDRVRLAEILLGPDEAMAMLERRGKA